MDEDHLTVGTVITLHSCLAGRRDLNIPTVNVNSRQGRRLTAISKVIHYYIIFRHLL